jgi:cytochrome b561
VFYVVLAVHVGAAMLHAFTLREDVISRVIPKLFKQ